MVNKEMRKGKDKRRDKSRQGKEKNERRAKGRMRGERERKQMEQGNKMDEWEQRRQGREAKRR